MKITQENIITDMRRNGISISKELFDKMNEFADIQNSFLQPLEVETWRGLKDKTILLVQDGQVLAVYGDNRFMYNPKKIKISDALDYDIYEVLVGGVNVQNRRQQRRDQLTGLRKSSETGYERAPRSLTYLFDKDWNPEVNKIYYSKLLQQKHLKRYAYDLEDAYDVVIELINQRKERLTGKRSEYDRMITKISSQIQKIEDEMTSAERDFSLDPQKLQKEVSKLPKLVKDAKDFIRTEEDEYKSWGKRKPIPYTKIEK